MDAYSISCADPSHRSIARIWQDLRNCRLHSVMGLQQGQALQVANMADERRSKHASGRPHVGIVGAGLAGLRCADVLLGHGFRVTILEGRDRLGGRVHQARTSAGYTVDMGPNWIHGTNDNPILELAKQANTAYGSWDSDTHVFDQDGQLLSLAEGERYSTMMWDIISDAFCHSNRNSATINADESFWSFFQKEVEKRIPEASLEADRARKSVYQLAEGWGNYVGNHIKTQSMKFFWLEECLDGENLFCAGTYEKILELIARPAVEGAEIKYLTTVNRIKTSSEGSKATLLTADGATHDFDEVVFTAPLGWLKTHHDAFDPPLPARLTKAIASLGYGCLEKVFITFPRAFWLVPESEGRSIKGFCQWLAPDYASDSNPEKWNQEIVELASLEPETSQPTLLFYIYGDQSRHLTSEVARLSGKEEKDALLYDFFRPYYSRLPGFHAASAACQPVACVWTDWLHDELAGNGSYVNFQVGLEEGDKDIETLREGLPDRGLWLAGEHTAPFVALGTATGAYWSGESIGSRIAEAYGRKKA